jgi:hypothetical protein
VVVERTPRLDVGRLGPFNLVEGVIDHHILQIHLVRTGPNELAWDLAFLPSARCFSWACGLWPAWSNSEGVSHVPGIRTISRTAITAAIRVTMRTVRRRGVMTVRPSALNFLVKPAWALGSSHAL